MKKNTVGIVIGMLVVSGCTPFYTNQPAPVVNMNAPLPGSYQGAQTMQPLIPPVGGQNQQAMLVPVSPATAQVTPVPVRPIAVSPSNGNNIVTSGDSPYAGTTHAQPVGGDDGWSIKPGEQKKKAENEETPINTAEANAVRPQARGNGVNETSASPTNTTDTKQDAASAGKQVASVAPTPEKLAETASSPIKLLLQKASASLGKGDLDGAAAYLENAQRIDSKNPKILYDIANIRFHQGRFKDAESFASRAVQVGGNNAMLKKSWSMIANARTKLGDNQGAILAAEKAASY